MGLLVIHMISNHMDNLAISLVYMDGNKKLLA